jgi:hypothetical protein
VLPGIPEDLTALVGNLLDLPETTPFLSPPIEEDVTSLDEDGDNKTGTPQLRVMFLVVCMTKLVIFVFSVSSGVVGGWRVIEFDG